MSRLQIHQVPVLSDNYLFVILDEASDATAAVDPALSQPVEQLVERLGRKLTHILNTHHHWDHVGGNLELKQRTGCTIVGPRADANRIPGIDISVEEGETFCFGQAEAQIFDVPGHTRGHIAYWFEKSNALFCGDTLFSLGCGRLFEGTPAQMWHSLSKLLSLPDQTKIYCAHEYTLANAKFALTVDPHNPDLRKHLLSIEKLRNSNSPTIPSSLGIEKRLNPFLRPNDKDIRKHLNLETQSDTEVFAEMRRRKDNF